MEKILEKPLKKSPQSKKTLLLNATYEVISFINERKMIKLVLKDKVEVISEWQDIISWENGSLRHPSILRLKKHVKRNYFSSNFSRKVVVKRDNSQCQYCSQKLSPSEVTIDHVLPRAHGGITSFTNCVVACKTCNNTKADKTPEQAKMNLLKKPTHPSFSDHKYIPEHQEVWNPEWENFLGHS
jgi:5-methylcytosine-specific restriction endonuclease McrA